METMDILQLSPVYLPARGFGGTITSIHEISKRLVKRGHQVTIATTDMISTHSRKPDLKHSEWIDEMLVKRYPVHSHFHQYYITPRLTRRITRENPDIIQGNGARNFQSDIGALYARRSNLPFVLVGYGSLIYYGLGDTLSKALYDAVTFKYMTKLSTRFVGQSGIECQSAMDYGIKKDRIRLIPTGTDLNKFSNGRPEELVEKYELDKFNAEHIILFVGRINPIKGLEFLFDAFAKLIRDKQHSSVLLLIVGEDQDHWRYLQTLPSYNEIKSQLAWVSKPTQRDIINAYHLADFFVLPSVYEHCPHVFHEAGACNLPVIATRVGGTPGVIHDGKTGLLVEHGDIEQLVSLMILFLNDKDLRIHYGKAIYNQTEKKYSWKVVARKYEQLYQSIAH